MTQQIFIFGANYSVHGKDISYHSIWKIRCRTVKTKMVADYYANYFRKDIVYIDILYIIYDT